jgi:hypothetical protein
MQYLPANGTSAVETCDSNVESSVVQKIVFYYEKLPFTEVEHQSIFV